MIDPLRPFRALAHALRRFFSRRAARKLVAQQLPRGLPAPEISLKFALRIPRALDAPPGEFWTLPLGAQAVRGGKPARLFRLAALPPPLRKLDVVRAPALRAALVRLRLPERLELPPFLETRVRDLGQVRPAHFRLDGEMRLPPEIDPPALAADKPPPAPPRRVRPRTPLMRAPLHRLRPRHFRLDPRSGAPANEGILPLDRREVTWGFIHPDLRREKIDLPWMARHRIRFLGPLQAEWFMMWWDQSAHRRPGAKEPRDYELERELSWALEECKEQMLIRRDVPKDENAPAEQPFSALDVGPTMALFENEPLTELIPEKEGVEKAPMLEPLPFDRGLREAYLQWRTLMDALEER